VTVLRTEQLKEFLISAAVLALQSAQRVPHHHFGEHTRGDNSKPRLEGVVVAGE
jgi:hypothetical protein